MKKPETKFKEKVRADLKKLDNTWFYKSQEVAVRGIPDFIMCTYGLFVALELKPDEKITLEPLQDYILERIRTKGKGIALKATPGTWPDIFEALCLLDKGVSIEELF